MYGLARIRCGFLSHERWRGRGVTIKTWSLPGFALGLVLVFVLVFFLAGVVLCAQGSIRTAPGIAWNVRGVWLAEGWRMPIRSGDPIVPGSLLEPGAKEAAHSITILLPDGQRILYECFTAIDCARGFRVPKLYRNPEPFAVGMLARIQAVLARQDREPKIDRAPHLASDEVVAELDANNRVVFGGLSASLSDGDYNGDLQSLSSESVRRLSVPLHKNGDSATLQLPGPGLYELIVSDSITGPRINVLLAAVRRGQGSASIKNFQDARKMMQDWDEYYQGWPIHDFQRAYLQALMIGITPPLDARTLTRASIVIRQGVTAEPEFTPRAGVFSGDTAVSLQCGTPGAVIHYTVDTSEPFESSPVYQAPVMVKGTALTIKAFSESPGRKDSAVVTGIFRIEDSSDDQ
jgi:Chitobiase/beta-hexosaminidase C-terminal domain